MHHSVGCDTTLRRYAGPLTQPVIVSRNLNQTEEVSGRGGLGVLFAQREQIRIFREDCEMALNIPLSVDLPKFIHALRSLFQAEHVYLRELIQNSLEATNQAALLGLPTGPISITFDLARGTLTVTDTGIGMTRQQLQSDLTRVFSSGWPPQAGRTLGIGQFGFGFFSTFLVSTKVQIITRSVHTPEVAFKWELKASDSAPRLTSIRKLPPIGTSVTLYIESQHRYMLDDEAITSEILKHYLYMPFPLTVAGIDVNVTSPDSWRSRLNSPIGVAETAEWLIERHGLKSKPILTRAITIDNGGWLSVVDTKDEAPSLDVFRRGIYVTSQELIPEPYNLFITGVVDMRDISVKPDRETLYRDAHYDRLVSLLLNESRKLTILAVKAIRESGRSIFSRHFNAASIALQRDKQLRKEVGLEFPVPLYTPDRGRTSLPLRDVIDNEGKKTCIYWSEDRSADAIFADRLIHLEKTPIYLGDPGTKQLVMQICQDHYVHTYALVEDYTAHLIRDRTSYPALKYVQALFSKELGDEWSVVSSWDIDTRLPLRLVRGANRSGKRTGENGGLAVLNTNNAAVRGFLRQAESLDIPRTTDFVKAVCSLAKLLTEPDEVAHHLELANKHFLANFQFADQIPQIDSEPNSPIKILQLKYANLLAAVRAFVSARCDEEPMPLWYLIDELRTHPRVADIVSEYERDDPY